VNPRLIDVVDVVPWLPLCFFRLQVLQASISKTCSKVERIRECVCVCLKFERSEREGGGGGSADYGREEGEREEGGGGVEWCGAQNLASSLGKSHY
jgi:hypothetical protein